MRWVGFNIRTPDDEYLAMKEWLETNISASIDDQYPNCEGSGWVLRFKGWEGDDHPVKLVYSYRVEISDPDIATLFRLIWQ